MPSRRGISSFKRRSLKIFSLLCLLRFHDVAKAVISWTELHTCGHIVKNRPTYNYGMKSHTADMWHDPVAREPSFLSKRGGTSLYITAELRQP